MPIPVIKYFVVLLFLPYLQITGLWAQKSYSIATYHIRFDNPTDTGNLREDRAPHLINLIRVHEMDIIGTREGLYTQMEDIGNDLDFPYIGVGEKSGEKEGQFCAVFYNPEKFQLLDKGAFLLPPTPEKPSKDLDVPLKRICSWGKFETPEGEYFYVFNVHNDSIGQTAPEESSKLLHKKITEINKEQLPCILTGDFDREESNPDIQKSIEEETLHESKGQSLTPLQDTIETFNPFNHFALVEPLKFGKQV